VHHLATSAVEAVISEVAWVLTYMTSGSEQYSQIIVEQGILPHLSAHLQSEHTSIIIPLLRTVGNIVRSDTLTDTLLSPSLTPPILPTLAGLLSHPHRAIKKEAAYAVSNIAGGHPPHHVDELVRHNLIPILAHTLRTSQFDVQKEVAYALSNIGADGRYIPALVEADIVPSFLALIRTSSAEVVLLALTFIEMVLSVHSQVCCVLA
jgi:importin subunit alpha-1